MSVWEDVKVGDKIKILHGVEYPAYIIEKLKKGTHKVNYVRSDKINVCIDKLTYWLIRSDGDKFEIISNSQAEEPDEVTGGSSPSYYRQKMLLPLSSDRSQFVEVDVECTDIIRRLNLTFDRANILKSVWRNDSKQGVDEKYSSDKILWSELQHRLKQKIITNPIFWETAKYLGLAKG